MTDAPRLSRRTVALGAAAKTLAGFAVVAMLLLLVRGDTRAEAQRDDIERVIGVLVECTTAPAERIPPVEPSPGDCYLRGQARTSSAVSQIGDLSIVAAACGAANPGDVPATRACVEAALDEASR